MGGGGDCRPDNIGRVPPGPRAPGPGPRALSLGHRALHPPPFSSYPSPLKLSAHSCTQDEAAVCPKRVANDAAGRRPSPPASQTVDAIHASSSGEAGRAADRLETCTSACGEAARASASGEARPNVSQLVPQPVARQFEPVATQPPLRPGTFQIVFQHLATRDAPMLRSSLT